MNDSDNITKRIALLNAWWFAVSNKNSSDHKRVVKLVKREMKSCGFPVPKGGRIALLNAYTRFLYANKAWVTYGVGPVGVCCTY
jgi:hypothetical protein